VYLYNVITNTILETKYISKLREFELPSLETLLELECPLFGWTDYTKHEHFRDWLYKQVVLGCKKKK
jgi:hypothetical protein